MTPSAHRVFGGVLHAPWPFPELPVAPPDARAHWTLEQAGEVPAVALVPLGEEAVNQAARVALARHDGGLRLTYSDTGTFDVLDDGRRLRWYPGAGADPAIARADVTGRVLPAALHLQGGLALHASAVAVAGQAIAFAAPKRHGKSTLAWALVRAGARLLTDDVLPLEGTAPVLARPGVHALLLGDDSGHALGVADDAGERRGPKRLLRDLPDDALQATPLPLAAVYLLHPVHPDASRPAARRARLAGPAAALGLTAHARLGALLRASAGEVLQRAAAVAGSVPVYGLEVARDLGQLDAAVDALLGWHGARAPGAA